MPGIEAWSVGLIQRSLAAIPTELPRPQSLRTAECKVQNFTIVWDKQIKAELSVHSKDVI